LSREVDSYKLWRRRLAIRVLDQSTFKTARNTFEAIFAAA